MAGVTLVKKERITERLHSTPLYKSTAVAFLSITILSNNLACFNYVLHSGCREERGTEDPQE